MILDPARFLAKGALMGLCATLFLTACGGGGNSGGGGTAPLTPTITAVAVGCSPASIYTNQTSTCTSTVSGTGNYSSSVTWSVSPTSIGTVDSTGVLTPAGTGTATITATSTQDNTKSGTASVAVGSTTANEWTWVSGNNIVGANGGQPGVYGLLGVASTSNVPGGRIGATRSLTV